MKTSVRSSYKKSDGLLIMHRGDSAIHYTTPMGNGQVGTRKSPRPPQDELAKVLRWARFSQPQMYKDYVNADSSMFHNIGKKNHSDTKAVKRMIASFNVMRIAYLETQLQAMEA